MRSTNAQTPPIPRYQTPWQASANQIGHDEVVATSLVTTDSFLPPGGRNFRSGSSANAIVANGKKTAGVPNSAIKDGNSMNPAIASDTCTTTAMEKFRSL